METRSRKRNLTQQVGNQRCGESCELESTDEMEDGNWPSGLRGLVNLGCTCYINSVLQVLAHTDAILKYFENDEKECSEPNCLVCDLGQVLSELRSGSRRPLAAPKLLYSIWKMEPEFADGGMHDAHDFWLLMISAFKRHENGSNLIDGLLRGRLATTLRCQSCENLSFVPEYVLDLSLPLHPSPSPLSLTPKDEASSCGLTSSIDSPVSDETEVTRSCQSGCEGAGDQVTGIKRKKRVLRRCGKCDNCVNPQRKKGCLRNKILRSMPVENSPQLTEDCSTEMNVLDYLQRPSVSLQQCLRESTRTELLQSWNCSQCGTLRNAKKETCMEKFPYLLAVHLKRFEFNSYTGLSRKLKTHVHCPAILEASCFGMHIPKQILSRYQLVAIIAHQGTLNGGHFWTFIRKEDEWYKINDSIVTQVDYKEVEDSQAYMVFYEKQIESTIPVS